MTVALNEMVPDSFPEEKNPDMSACLGWSSRSAVGFVPLGSLFCSRLSLPDSHSAARMGFD